MMFVSGEGHLITVAKLRELLLQLDDADLLQPNECQNLAVIRADEYIGYVDLGREEKVEIDP